MVKNSCNVQAKFEIEELLDEVQDKLYDSLVVVGVKELSEDTLEISVASTPGITTKMTISLLQAVVVDLISEYEEAVAPPEGSGKALH